VVRRVHDTNVIGVFNILDDRKRIFYKIRAGFDRARFMEVWPLRSRNILPRQPFARNIPYSARRREGICCAAHISKLQVPSSLRHASNNYVRTVSGSLFRFCHPGHRGKLCRLWYGKKCATGFMFLITAKHCAGAVERKAGEVYNIGATTKEQCGDRQRILLGSKTVEARSFSSRIGQARPSLRDRRFKDTRELGWRPKYSSCPLDETITWYMENPKMDQAGARKNRCFQPHIDLGRDTK